ncbi:carbamoyltransferase C-terminal domain-containing protein [Xenorhabdus bovienii]|uniref:carbamoyltransferase C-terminal domain-containing protein n=1 Tax=Xenorhabdus bovienii TaxID=40576 RepID=UPI0023B2D72C|nr:carbamoyltransferase C-terminal domain-containing protein [Xenorhabdus bovienii]MDE9463079.1 proline dehydrogenase [Xenorhabdus bovienii]
MKILSFKPGHDGSIAYVSNGKLLEVIEAEKDNNKRYSELALENFILDGSFSSNVFALSGWSYQNPEGRLIGSGYTGLKLPERQTDSFFSSKVPLYSSSHERSHILCSYALSPYPQGQPCYCILWEGYIGAFYYIDKHLNITKLKNIMHSPGEGYSFAYALCDKKFNLPEGGIRLGDAGKLMALAAFDYNRNKISSEERECLNKIFENPNKKPNLCKSKFQKSPFYDCGIASDRSKRLARLVSNYIYEYFFNEIKSHVNEHIPLLISGGCGLNCDWNRGLLDSGLFADVFVPPVTNDSGSSIGTAADVQFFLTGNGKLNWNVYSGQSFIDDLQLENVNKVHNYVAVSYTPEKTARMINHGAIIAWTSGKMEIGPRALGNRSILAEPFNQETTNRLNRIKKREDFRPIAPICMIEDTKSLFDFDRESPYMLFFTKVLSSKLKAITHVDGSARVQTVNKTQNEEIYALLKAFKDVTGYGVLCNTSLNFHHHGFINRSSDLIRYVSENHIDGFYVNGKLFIKNIERFGLD